MFKYVFIYRQTGERLPARPDGSFIALKDSSHSMAFAEEQATEGPHGTHSAALGTGNNSSKDLTVQIRSLELACCTGSGSLLFPVVGLKPVSPPPLSGCRSSCSQRHPRTALSDAMPRSPAGRFETFTQDMFSILPLPHILSCGLMRMATSRIFIRERNARFNTPCGHRFVSTCAVKHVQRLQFTYGLFMQLFRVRRLMEVQVAAKHFIRTFT